MPNQEVLKKLIEDFVEKEALVAEEIQIIHDEIGQLHARLEQCRQRLSTIGGDRQKVLAIKERCLTGNGQLLSLPVHQLPQTAQSDNSVPENRMVAPWPVPVAQSAPAPVHQWQPAAIAQPAAPSPPPVAQPAAIAPPTALPLPQPLAAPLPRANDRWQTEGGEALPVPEGDDPDATLQGMVPPHLLPAYVPAPTQTATVSETDAGNSGDPGAPLRATLRGAPSKKNKSAISSILGPLRTAAAQLTNSQPTPPQPRRLGDAGDGQQTNSVLEDNTQSAAAHPAAPPMSNYPAFSDTGSYIPPSSSMAAALEAYSQMQELPHVQMPEEPAAAFNNADISNQPPVPADQTGTQAQTPPVKDNANEQSSGKENAELDDNDPIKRINDELRSLFK
jgi:hypothetical protein